MKRKISAAKVRKIISYDPYSGVFRWKIDMALSCKSRKGAIAGGFNAQGYRIIMIYGRSYRASHVAFALMTGRWPSNTMDHCDLNRANDQWNNLREATYRQNSMNRPIRQDNVTGYKGVYNHPGERFRARIRVNGKLRSLGLFDSKEAAFSAYAKASKDYHGEFGRLR